MSKRRTRVYKTETIVSARHTTRSKALYMSSCTILSRILSREMHSTCCLSSDAIAFFALRTFQPQRTCKQTCRSPSSFVPCFLILPIRSTLFWVLAFSSTRNRISGHTYDFVRVFCAYANKLAIKVPIVLYISLYTCLN
jgi:hypothetical protein